MTTATATPRLRPDHDLGGILIGSLEAMDHESIVRVLAAGDAGPAAGTMVDATIHGVLGDAGCLVSDDGAFRGLANLYWTRVFSRGLTMADERSVVVSGRVVDGLPVVEGIDAASTPH